MAAVMSSDMQNTDKVVIFIEECRNMGIPPALPNVNTGEYMFTVNDEGVIVYGLGAIKGVGEGPIEAIVEARAEGGPFEDLFDFCERVGAKKLNKRVLEALVRSGAVDCLGAERAVLWEAIPDALKAADQAAKNQDAGMFDLFGEVEAESDRCSYEDYRNVRSWTDKERLAGEKDTLGLYLTGHPIDEYENELRHFISKRIVELQPARGQTQKMAGLVVDLRLKKTKKGDNLCFVTLDDRSARIDVTLFGDTYDAVREMVHKDAVLIVEGEVAEDHFSGGMKVRVNKVLSIPQARAQYAQGVQVNCDHSHFGGRKVKELQELLNTYRGEGALPLQLKYHREDAEAVLTLGDKWQVQATDDLMIALMERFGSDAVRLTY